MRLHVRHETAYTYDGEVQASYNELRLLPAAAEGRHVLAASIETAPHGAQRPFTDYYGNRVVYLEVQEPHRRLTIVADMTVETAGPTVLETGRPPEEFLHPGTLTTPDPDTAAVLAPLAVDRPAALAEAVRGLLRYARGVTDTATDVNAALRLGAGVCQDFTHAFVTACRLHGLPARYVGGYLLQDGPGAPHHSHAWAEVWDGRGWLGCDPTNGCPVDERYLAVAAGRDYGDVPPVKGVFLGAGPRGMQVRLRVAAEAPAGDDQ